MNCRFALVTPTGHFVLISHAQGLGWSKNLHGVQSWKYMNATDAAKWKVALGRAMLGEEDISIDVAFEFPGRRPMPISAQLSRLDSFPAAGGLRRQFVCVKFQVLPAGYELLTPREKEVLRLPQGMSTERQAATLHISPSAVRTHRSRIAEKLGLNSNESYSRAAHRMNCFLGGPKLQAHGCLDCACGGCRLASKSSH